jgi:hypothetical protein
MVYAYCMYYQRRVLGTQKAHKMHTFYRQYKVCIPVSSGDLAEGVSVWRAALGRHPSPVLVHGEAALHGALGEQPENRGPAPHHIHESRMKAAVKTKAKKTNDQASFVGSILKANMEVKAAIQLAYDLDETGMPCVCIGAELPSVLLNLPERV